MHPLKGQLWGVYESKGALMCRPPNSKALMIRTPIGYPIFGNPHRSDLGQRDPRALLTLLFPPPSRATFGTFCACAFQQRFFFWFWGLGFRISGLGFRVSGFAFRV